MPAINVARTDTFELQRQKINQIGARLFDVTGGGSDLSTGNLKLGDGTVIAPSLAFDTDATLGLYKADTKTLGFVSTTKRVLELSDTAVTCIQDLNLTQEQLTTNGVTILNAGSLYEGGTYNNIPLTGGSGVAGEATIVVTPYGGSVTNFGAGYTPGNYGQGSGGIKLNGGTGSGVEVSFDVDGIAGTVVNAGSNYAASTTTNAVPLTGGNGSGAEADIITGTSGEVLDIVIVSQGSGYLNGDILSVNPNFDGAGTGSGFQYRIDGNPGIVSNFQILLYGTGYTSGNVLSLPGDVTGVSADLKAQITGFATTLNTTSYQITVADTTGLVAGMTAFGGEGDTGTLVGGTTIQSVDSATQITLDQFPLTSGAATLGFTSAGNLTEFVVADVSVLYPGMPVTKTGGNGSLAAGTVINSISGNTVQLNNAPTGAGTATLTFGQVFGSGTTPFAYTVGAVGTVNNVTITQGGTGYEVGNLLSVDAENLVSPIEYVVTSASVIEITFTGNVSTSAFAVGDVIQTATGGEGGGTPVQYEVFKIESAGGNITRAFLNALGGVLQNGDDLEDSTNTAIGTVDTCTNPQDYYFLSLGDTGNPLLLPDLTFYSGNTYVFNIQDSSLTSIGFALSSYPDGIHAPSLVTPVSTTLSNVSKDISVNSAAGIVVGMEVTVLSGTGALLPNTVVESINGTTITLSNVALTSGPVQLEFKGFEFIRNVTRTINELTILIDDNTPNLYYYSPEASDVGGKNGEEALITVDLNNPRTFGSGFSLEVLATNEVDIISNNILTGMLTAAGLTSSTLSSSSGNISSLTSGNISGNTISLNEITNNSGTLDITASQINLSGGIDFSGKGSFDNANGNLEVTGVLKTLNSVNINDKLFITDNVVSSAAGSNITFTPSLGQSVKVNSSTSLVIPVGTDAQRPGVTEDGAIRFNTDSQSYEGYSASTTSWSSLGGVRDQDGNTYILAEETVGANDNTLWFYNDAVNTVRFTTEYQEFVNVKKVRSPNVAAPAYSNWTANSPAVVGDYLKYRNNIYEVTAVTNTAPGAINLTASSGNPPIHNSGATTNGDLELTFSVTAVSSLTFEEISEVNIDPLGFTDLVINNEIRISGNTISTDTNDLVLQPNPGQKAVINASSSLVLPVGNNNQKGNAAQGSVRYNTDDNQFEGYNGAQWGGLGGVKDIDQDTFIQAESAPGADEDILFFYNQNSNTLQLTGSGLDFYSVDTLNSETSDTFNINAATITFSDLATTLDNTNSDKTFLFSTREFFDLGLSSGLTTDPLLRLTDTGDVFYNLGFGTGTYNGIKLFDSELKELEIADFKIVTKKVTLERGTLNEGDAVIYDPSVEASAKVIITGHNTSTGDKEIVEYSVTDKGTDVFFSEIGNISTGVNQFSTVFDLNDAGNVRVTFTLDTSLTSGDDVEFTVVSQITKR
tara:strand:+ start:418 stop:4689 length:4272 start_codon:yes stop_codon:yes gene_type:complete